MSEVRGGNKDAKTHELDVVVVLKVSGYCFETENCVWITGVENTGWYGDLGHLQQPWDRQAHLPVETNCVCGKFYCTIYIYISLYITGLEQYIPTTVYNSVLIVVLYVDKSIP